MNILMCLILQSLNRSENLTRSGQQDSRLKVVLRAFRLSGGSGVAPHSMEDCGSGIVFSTGSVEVDLPAVLLYAILRNPRGSQGSYLA